MFGGNMMGSGKDSTPYRYLRLGWPGAYNGAQGFNDLRFVVNGVSYPPAMTGYNAPAPYAISVLRTTTDFWGQHADPLPWRAFDADAGSVWYYPDISDNWLQLDCGSNLRICPDAISAVPRTLDPAYPGGLMSPFTLWGSNDGTAFTTMALIPHPAGAWTPGDRLTLPTGLSGKIKAV